MEDNKSSNKIKSAIRNAPLEVKIISILVILRAFYPIFSWILEGNIFSGGDYFGYMFIYFIFMIVFAICITATSIMFLTGKNLAKTILLIILSIWLLLDVYSFILRASSFSFFINNGLSRYLMYIRMIFYLVSMFYILFNKKIKEYFKNLGENI